MRRGGIRLSLTAAHTADDVTRVIQRLAEHVPAVLAEEGLSVDFLDQEFSNALPQKSTEDASLEALIKRLVTDKRAPTRAPAPVIALAPRRPVETNDGLSVERYTSIQQIDEATWNSLLGTVGFISWDALVMAEQVFSGETEPENTWEFLYVLVRDANGRVIAAAPFTVALCKGRHAHARGGVVARRRSAAGPTPISSPRGRCSWARSSPRATTLSGSLRGPGAPRWRASSTSRARRATGPAARCWCCAMLRRRRRRDESEMLHHGLVECPCSTRTTADHLANGAGSTSPR